GTKKGLFLAALDRVYEDVRERWEVALRAEIEGEDGVAISAERARMLLDAEDELGDGAAWSLLFQAWAAMSDKETADAVHGKMDGLFRLLYRESGGSFEEVGRFWSRMVMMIVAGSIGAWGRVETSMAARAMLE